ncbi:MAG: LysR substrate-binding domain-containing protein [Myxococcaceae bacterium]|nr:LysR substrate-binding domain-containing protein [Myxococcaceae bacterium]
MLDFRRLRYFLEVAEQLHFTRAAQALGISQQPLSRAIGALERDLGVQLFERTTRAVRLTPAGEALLDHGTTVLQQLALAERAARAGGRPSLRVVYPGTLGGLPHRPVEAFARAHPAVDVRMGLVRSWEQEPLLLSGQADLAFVVPPVHDERLSFQPVVDVTLVAVVPRDSALARKRRTSLADLRDQRWVLYSPRRKRPLAEFVRGCCAASGFTPRRGAEAVDEDEAIRLVSQGDLVALVSEGTRVGRECVKRPLAERPTITIAATWRRSDTRPVLRSLIDVITDAGLSVRLRLRSPRSP